MNTPKAGRRGTALLLAAVVAGLLAPALAAPAEDPIEIGELDLDALLDPRVAAVSLKVEASSAAPASVFVLTAADLRAQGFQTLAEALRSVPGLFTYSDGFYQYAGFRGVGQLVDYTVRTLVLVDGHPLNNTLGAAENSLGRDMLVPLAMVERIEVVKGPVGSVYGPTAFLGVVNVVTRSAAAEGSELVLGGQGSQGRLTAGDATAVTAARLGALSVVAGAEVFQTRGYTWTYPELATASDRPAPPGGQVAGVDFGDAQKGYFRATWRDLTAQGGCGHWFRGLPSAPYSVLIGDHRNAEETLACFALLAAEHRLGDALSVSGKIAYDHFSYRDLLGYDEPPAGVGPFRDTTVDDWVTGNLGVRWRPVEPLLLTAGATLEAHATTMNSFSERIPTLLVDPVNGLGVGPIRNRFRTLNTYLLVEWQALAALTVHGGLTWYDHELFGSRLTPKVAAVWRATKAGTLKAIYTEGFRAPSVTEAFFTDVIDFVPNRALRPETARSYELAYEHRVSAGASLFASAFVNRYQNLIATETFQVSGPPGSTDPTDYREQSRNGAGLEVLGLEVGAALRLGPALDAYGGLSAQRTRGGKPPNFAQVTANAAVSTRALWRPLALALRGALVGARDKDASSLGAGQRPSLGSQLRLDAQAALDVPGAGGLTLELGIYNLLDGTILHPVAGDFTPISEMAEPPRTVRLGARIRF